MLTPAAEAFFAKWRAVFAADKQDLLARRRPGMPATISDPAWSWWPFDWEKKP